MKGLKLLNILRILALVFIFLTWPLSFFLHNSASEFIFYFAPTFLLIFSLVLFNKQKSYWTLPMVLVGIFNPLLALFPLLASVLDLIFLYRNKVSLLITVLSLVIFASAAVKFKSDSIFYFDQNDYQTMIRNTYLYPDVYTTRLFQNKPSIYLNRFNFNFFALVDPNNYFFHFHPREISVTNQNLEKFPFLAIFLFLIGLYFYKRSPNWKFIFIILTAAIINLSLIKNFDKNDFILYLPIGLIILGGLKMLNKKSVKLALILIIFLVFSFVQVLHLIVSGLVG